MYDRLIRLGIPSCRSLKSRFNNQRSDIRLPEQSEKLAELFGILLRDGHVFHFQVTVTLGTKELQYALYVRRLIKALFGGVPRVTTSAVGHRTVYLGSTAATRWLLQEGMVRNRVASQVDIPSWISSSARTEKPA